VGPRGLDVQLRSERRRDRGHALVVFVVREVVEIRREHGVAAPDRPVLRPGHLVADPVDQVLTDRVIVGIVFFLLCVRARRVRIVAIAERRFCL